MMLGVFKRLYERLAPWYDEEKHRRKDEIACASEAEVRTFAIEAKKVIDSYRKYGEQVAFRRGIRNVHTKREELQATVHH